jgi:hypothetical protein
MRLLSARTQLNYPTRLGDDDLETYRLSEITRVDFGGDYENALRLIGGSKYQNAMDLIWGPSNPHKVKRRSWTQARGSMRQIETWKNSWSRLHGRVNGSMNAHPAVIEAMNRLLTTESLLHCFVKSRQVGSLW